MERWDEALAAARLLAADHHPYLATALFALSVTPTPGLGTMATDRHWRLYVDPAVVDVWTIEQLSAVLVHEVHHQLRDHSRRAEQLGVEPADARRFNVAADLEINDDLSDEGLPPGGLFPAPLGLPQGELAETYFVLLAGRSLPQVNCGSAAHGCAQAWELPGVGGDDDGRPAGVTGPEGDLIRAQVARDVRAARQAGGHVPSGIERWAQAFLEPKVDWRRQLGALVRAGIDVTSGAVDYSYRRPSRRAGSPLGRAVILPALVQPVPRVAVVVDTSGSMDSSLLEQALAEVKGILRSSGVATQRLAVLACDTAVRTTQTVFSADRVELVGGGGTNMGAGIEGALDLRPRPEVVVVLTDGFTLWPARRPPVSVVVALLGDRAPSAPSWARSVRVEV